MRTAYSCKTSDKVAAPSRGIIDAQSGPVVVEFGSPWCGRCRTIEPLLARLFALYPHVQHIKIEDGRGRRLGRLFNVKLWPTLIFLRDGKELTRLVRPDGIGVIEKALLIFADTDVEDAVVNH
jgi:thioredoxin 1